MNRFTRLPLTLALLLLLGACHPLEDAYCNARLPKTRVLVQALPIHYLLVQRLDARQLGDAHSDDGERITYGLTTATPSVQAEIQLHVTTLPGAVCVRPDLTVTLGYQPMQVDMARELAPASCPYATVFGHEMKHVDVYREHLAKVAKALEAEVRSRIGSALPTRFANLAASEKAMQDFQNDWLVPRASELLQAVAAEQNAVDSEAEYARVAAACPGDTLLSGARAPNP